MDSMKHMGHAPGVCGFERSYDVSVGPSGFRASSSTLREIELTLGWMMAPCTVWSAAIFAFVLMMVCHAVVQYAPSVSLTTLEEISTEGVKYVR